jgi:hypothetical protein
MEYMITCKRCGYDWEPEASRWKNMNNLCKDGTKILYCPRCKNPKQLSQEDTVKLLDKLYKVKLKVKIPKRRRLPKHGKETKKKI